MVIGFGLLVLLALVAGGFHIAAVLGLVAVSLSQAFSIFPLINALGQVAWSANADFILVAIPMFILMGELLLHSGVSQAMYEALGKWLNRLPGGLMHSNIAACALFAASSGSSVATAATIGTMAIPNVKRKGYNPALFLGTLAAGGTLGILIPPSIPLIVYAVLAETSIIHLYLAALIPGVFLAVLMSAAVLAICVVRPDLGGRPEPSSWRERLAALPHLLPPILLFLIVIGSIYAGIATPTEAAALGVIAALLLAAWRGALTRTMLMEACARTMGVTAMIMLILMGAFFLNFVMVSVGLTRDLVAFMTSLNLSSTAMMVAIVVFYLILGCFMETLSMLVATTPIVLPIVKSIGYDPIWFGVVFMVLLEAAMITPPVGVNLYVIQTVRGGGPIRDVIVGSLPLLVMMIGLVALLIAMPQIALWLPQLYTESRS